MRNRIILIAICIAGFSRLYAAPAQAASCGGWHPPQFLDTLENGAIVLGNDAGITDTSYPADLNRAVDSLLHKEKNVAVATVHGTCTLPAYETMCVTGFCLFTISIDTVLKGTADTRGFSFSVRYGCGYDDPNWFLEGKRFLIYADTVPFTHATAGGPCYSPPRGFFLEDGRIISHEIAPGQGVPLRSLERFPVGIRARPARRGAARYGLPYRVDGRKPARSAIGPHGSG